MDLLNDALRSPSGNRLRALQRVPSLIADRFDDRLYRRMARSTDDQDQSALCRIIDIWQRRDIQVAELAVCSLFIPVWSVWLILPFHTFSNPIYHYMAAIGPEEYWGLWGVVVALVWSNGVAYGKRPYRLLGSAVTAIALANISASQYQADKGSLGVPINACLATLCAVLFWRQCWETKAGEP